MVENIPMPEWETKNVYTKDKLKEVLHQNVCEVTFTKVDGTVRTMPCTLREDLLPSTFSSHPDSLNPNEFNINEGVVSKKKPNDAVLSVWCLDKESWRSFRVENVTKVVIVNK